jgi:hypothetical protein
MPQFPGVEFQSQGIELDDAASLNDAAICTGLIHCKHRWPGELIEPEGSGAFRLKASATAEEIGVPLKGARPTAREVSLHRGAPRRENL